MMDVLAVVPARGGSKGLPRKNLRLLDGHPLVGWAVAAGMKARGVTRTLCSTDDPDIAAAARRYGAEVPFLRPPDLACDLTPDLPVFQHALDWFDRNEGWRPELVVQLRPTSPIRPLKLVDESIEMLVLNEGATSVRAVCPAPCNPHKMWRLAEDTGTTEPYMTQLLDVPGIVEPYNAPRQALPPVWWQTGCIDTVRSEVIRGGSMTGSSLLPLKIESRYAIDIDNELSLRMAEFLLPSMDCVRPAPPLRWDAIRLLVLDVDGTLTPGAIDYGPGGEELKTFHTHDGKGIALVRQVGVEVAIITEESTPFTNARAAKLNLREVFTGIKNKVDVLKELCERMGVSLNEVAYVGDDVGDLPAMQLVGRSGGIPCAVADARPEIKAVVRFLSPTPGGRGAVRDVCDRILEARKQQVHNV